MFRKFALGVRGPAEKGPRVMEPVVMAFAVMALPVIASADVLGQRLADLNGVKSPKLTGFFRQAFDDERVMGMLLLDKTKVKVNDLGNPTYDFTRAAPRIEGMFDSMCRIIEANRLTSMRATIEGIAKQSASEAIRRRGEQCAARLKASPAGA